MRVMLLLNETGSPARPMGAMLRRIFFHLGVLCLLVASVHSLVWFALLTPQLYYAIPPIFLAYLGVSFIATSRMRTSKSSEDDHDA